ncbi:Uncharacterised protein [uncultured Clostridium sp.]|uniref:hypothetical protein n=1 Tax=uncultured Clostridium sp. TaxID=59620 RepID=UPI00082299AF|nr:hypothetical protein [uncultured Clostridium sp.]SCJ34689.1 Uncharacterised protein [uncultured Clostridium sp.]
MRKRWITYICLVIGVLLIIVIYKKNNSNFSTSIGKISLYIETYLAGKNQPTHPNIIKFNERWNGYKYWMGYTPFPWV